MEICGDNRFEIIAKAKAHLLDATNIDTSEDEMKVLDNFLYRCWQMGWLDRYDRKTEPQTHLLVTEYPQDGEVTLIGRDKTEAVVMAYDVYKELTEPQTEDKHAVCTGCDYYDLPNAFHPCASCVDFSKYKPKIEDEPQTDCSWR